ncbi:hypothetical protein B0H63DRAFT_522291 [Podospora didyma]|uniref:Transmembrane protein n=1 Tax=Podospora didyma TaxID=330526 RepID=A0AAE0NNV3_9PEZI|nr:hypothetical protein B0H63DRAFT_522291 [Podospora didyma]
MGFLPRYNISELLFGGVVQLITLPYRRFFTYNTLRPVQDMVSHAARGVDPTSPDRQSLHAVLVSWRSRKKDELGFVAVAHTGHRRPSAKVMERHLNQILGRRQSILPAVRHDDVGGDDNDNMPGGELTWVLNWRLIFSWQCPMMFIAYSTLFYLVGLSVVAGTPLIAEEWGPSSYVSVAYFASLGLGLALFALCSLAGYNRISMHDEEDGSDTGIDARGASTTNPDESKVE